MRGEMQMKVTAVAGQRIPILTAAVAFIGVLIPGTLLTAVMGLFAYANAPVPNALDSRFLTILIAGVCLTVVASTMAAMRAVRAASSDGGSGAAYSLLKKYRRADTRPGGDSQAGQYQIGERYLRELLGRRGA